MTELSTTLYSGKGSLHTCTRRLGEAQGSPVCVVEGVKRILRAYKAELGRFPPKEASLFTFSDGKVFTRAQISEVLRAGAMECGVSSSRVASHSLRRGGASCYAVAGVPHESIRQFGRWQSMGYRIYITAHADMMNSGEKHPWNVVPRFDRN